MLPAAARLTEHQDFRSVTRGGKRVGGKRLVLYVLPDAGSPAPAKVGFVVSKAVGNSVIRHRVTRQLRHVMRSRIDALPSGTSIVVRALAPAAGSSSAVFSRDVDRAFDRLGLVRANHGVQR